MTNVIINFTEYGEAFRRFSVAVLFKVGGKNMPHPLF